MQGRYSRYRGRNPEYTVHVLLCQADYTRYEGSRLQTALARVAVRPGAALLRRLRGYLRPKCHPVLLDTRLNSRTTVRLNIFQVP